MPLPPFFSVDCYDLKFMSFKFSYDIFVTFEMPGVAYSRLVDKIHISLQFRPSVIRAPWFIGESNVFTVGRENFRSVLNWKKI